MRLVMFFFLLVWIVVGTGVRWVIHTLMPMLITENYAQLAFEILLWPYMVWWFIKTDFEGQ